MTGIAGGGSTNASDLTSGTLDDARLSANVTLQGNAFNGVNQLLQLDGDGKLPSVDGSALTNLSAANLTGALPALDGGALSNVTAAALANDIDMSPGKVTSLWGADKAYALFSDLGGGDTLIKDSAGNILGIMGSGQLVLGSSQLTTATKGFLRIPTCAGTPTGVPSGSYGAKAIVYDSTNKALMLYDSGWKAAIENASLLTTGTVPDARFPATLPAASGVNLTALNGSNIASGTVAVARGGTGLGSGTSGGILGFTASGTLASSGALTANALLLGGGAGATPSAMGSLGTTAQVLHGNASGAPTWGAIVNADITNATIDLTSKVTGTLPIANGGTGITSWGTGVATAHGNNTNAASGFVVLDGSAKLPAVDGSALTNLPASSQNLSTQVELWDECLSTPSTTVGTGPLGFIGGQVSSGAAPALTTTPDNGSFGVWQFSTASATASTSYAIQDGTTLTSLRLGGGAFVYETRIRIPTLSDGTNTFTASTGIANNAPAFATSDVCFKYTHGTNSGHWTLETKNNSVATTADSGIAVVAGTWYRLRAEINAAGTSITYYINGSSVGTITTNIPTASGRELCAAMDITKSAGSTARTLLVDYVYMKWTPTTPR